jgi:hypothetical protein
MEIKILGICRDPSKVDSSFMDFVRTPDDIGDLQYDYVVDINEVTFIVDPRQFIKPLYEAIYSDFFDKNDVIRLNHSGGRQGVLVKKNVYEVVAFDIEKITFCQYIPRPIFKIA